MQNVIKDETILLKNNFNAIPIRFEKGLHRIQDFAFKAQFVTLISVFTFVSNICAKPQCLKSCTVHTMHRC